MRLRAAGLVCAWTLGVALIGCGKPAPPPEIEPVAGPVRIAVDRDLVELAGRWRRDLHEDPAAPVTIEVVETDAALGLASLIEGRVAAAIVLRRATEAEDRYAAGDDLVPREGLRYEVIARRPVTLLVHADAFVDVLSRDELTRVLAGEVREWDSFGGPASEIALYGRQEGSETAAIVRRMLGGRPPAEQLKALPTDQAVATAVAADPLGLGVGGGAPGRGTKSLAIRDGEQVLMPGAGAGSAWPWVRNVYIVTQGAPARRVEVLRDYARSEAGRRLAEQAGFVGWMEGWTDDVP